LLEARDGFVLGMGCAACKGQRGAEKEPPWHAVQDTRGPEAKEGIGPKGQARRICIGSHRAGASHGMI